MGLATVTIEGRLTKDPELRFIPSGKAVCSLTVATSDSKKDDTTGEWVETGKAFFNVTAWELLGENVAESLVKGDEVVVIGKLSQREYEKDGDKRTSYQEIRAFNIAPSLRRKVAKVQRTERGSAAPAGEAAADPWFGAPATLPDEPPF